MAIHVRETILSSTKSTSPIASGQETSRNTITTTSTTKETVIARAMIRWSLGGLLRQLRVGVGGALPQEVPH